MCPTRKYHNAANLERVQQEAVRRGALAEQLMGVSLEKERQVILLDMIPVRGQCCAARRTIASPCARVIAIKSLWSVIGSITSLRVNTDDVFQVLLNLVTNANRQTQSGVITGLQEKLGKTSSS